ncbi:hypothetical protein C8R44DRAFT_738790 [Mycena epipterygia]|nr:hypothetical protein C8R44DRAFT_738790 [Mycena epipterygia]
MPARKIRRNVTKNLWMNGGELSLDCQKAVGMIDVPVDESIRLTRTMELAPIRPLERKLSGFDSKSGLNAEEAWTEIGRKCLQCEGMSHRQTTAATSTRQMVGVPQDGGHPAGWRRPPSISKKRLGSIALGSASSRGIMLSVAPGSSDWYRPVIEGSQGTRYTYHTK